MTLQLISNMFKPFLGCLLFQDVEGNLTCSLFCSQLQQPGAGSFSSCPATPPGGSMLHSKSPPLPSFHHAGAPPLPSFPTASSAAAAAVILQQHSAGKIISCVVDVLWIMPRFPIESPLSANHRAPHSGPYLSTIFRILIHK